MANRHEALSRFISASRRVRVSCHLQLDSCSTERAAIRQNVRIWFAKVTAG